MANEIKIKLDQLKKDLDPNLIAKEAFPVFVRATPVKSGNARNNTTLRANTINADYPYAQRLNEGWSKQSPQGMVKPVQDWFNNYIKEKGK